MTNDVTTKLINTKNIKQTRNISDTIFRNDLSENAYSLLPRGRAKSNVKRTNDKTHWGLKDYARKNKIA